MKRAALFISIFLISLLASNFLLATNKQFNPFTKSSDQEPKNNATILSVENCEDCEPPHYSQSLLDKDCSDCGSSNGEYPFMNLPQLDSDCQDCAQDGREPFTTMQQECPDCEPFQMHPYVEWCDECGKHGTGLYLHNGAFYHQVTDLEIPSVGFCFQFIRRHRSDISYDGPLGYNWEFNYNIRLMEDSQTGDVSIYNGFGRSDTYNEAGGSYISPAGFFDHLSKDKQNNQFILQKWNGTKYIFSSSSGTLEQIEDRNGNAMTFSYDPEGRLTTITDTSGRNITLTYDANGRIDDITDFNSRVVNYTYDANGDLIGVTSPSTVDFPSGKTITYTYDSSHRIDTITDPKNQTYLDNTYDANGKVMTLQYGDTGDNFSISYDSVNRKTTVIDRNGNIQEYYYSVSGNPTSIVEKTNRDVRPNEGDYTTNYSYNSDFLLTGITFHELNSIEYVYDSSNPNNLATSNLLEEGRKPAPGSSVPFLMTKWTYESNYNQVKTVIEPRGNLPGADPDQYKTTFIYDFEESTLGDQNGDGITNQTAGNVVKIEHPTVTIFYTRRL